MEQRIISPNEWRTLFSKQGGPTLEQVAETLTFLGIEHKVGSFSIDIWKPEWISSTALWFLLNHPDQAEPWRKQKDEKLRRKKTQPASYETAT